MKKEQLIRNDIDKENYKTKKITETFVINLIAISLPVLFLLIVLFSNLFSLWC